MPAFKDQNPTQNTMKDFRFKPRFGGHVNWVSDGKHINSHENLQKIQHILEEVGAIIVEHWYLSGASAPGRFIFENYEDFTEYLMENAFAGDSIHVWSMYDVCNDDNQLAYGKCPDENGQTPEGGAY